MPVLKQKQNGEWVTKGSNFPYKVGGLAPSGTLSISANGTYDVSQYASAVVSVPSSDISWDDIAERTLSGTATGNASYIKANAFQNCTALTSASFPVCTNIGPSAFYYCTALTSASFPVCTNIGVSAFYYCTALTSASFPVCTNIGGYAFSGCTSLTTVSFPACASTGGGVFQNCVALTSVSFPVCTNIEINVFQNCKSLTTASFPACKIIGSSAFRSCYNLLSLYLLGSSVPTLSNVNAFTSTPISDYTTSTGGVYGSIIVQSSMLDTFKTATNWSVYSNRFSVWNGID